jgi:hypothetical protein
MVDGPPPIRTSPPAVRIRPSAGRGAGQLAQEQRVGRGFDLTWADDEYAEARPCATPDTDRPAACHREAVGQAGARRQSLASLNLRQSMPEPQSGHARQPVREGFGNRGAWVEQALR